MDKELQKAKEKLRQLREQTFIKSVVNAFEPINVNFNNSFKQLIKLFNSKFEGQGNQIMEVKNDTETIQNAIETVLTKIDNIKIIKGDKGDRGEDLVYDSLSKDQKKKIIEQVYKLIPTPKNGRDGQDGTTPIKGVDYFTDTEIKTIISEVVKQIPTIKEPQKVEVIDELSTFQFDVKDIIKDWKNLPLKDKPLTKEIVRDYQRSIDFAVKQVQSSGLQNPISEIQYSKEIVIKSQTLSDKYIQVFNSDTAMTVTLKNGSKDGQEKKLSNIGIGTVVINGNISNITATDTLYKGETIVLNWDSSSKQWQ